MSFVTSTSDVPAPGGIYDGFEGFRTPSRDEHIKVLKTGLVVLDANVLLDLYRFGKQGRDDLMAALRAVGDRLWVPHHAMSEFWKRREGVLKDPGETKQLIKSLTESRDKTVAAIETWGRRRSHPPSTTQKLAEAVAKTLDGITEDIAQLSQEETHTWARETTKDEVLIQLEALLAAKIGPPLPKAAYDQALVEAKKRGEQQVPPGFLDAKKPEPDSAGDYLIWEQLLIEASTRNTDVLFITRDEKEDWVRRESGETRGPRIELQDELRQRTGNQFYLLTPAKLLSLARESLSIEVDDASVQDVARISDEVSALLELSPNVVIPRRWDFSTAALFLSELSRVDPTAADAIRLAVLKKGWIDSNTFLRLGIQHTSPDDLMVFAAHVNAVLLDLIGRGDLPPHATGLLRRRKKPSGNSAILWGFQIRDEFLFDLWQATLAEPDDAWGAFAVMEERRKALDPGNNPALNEDSRE